MIGHTKVSDHLWTIVLAMEVRDMSPSFLVCAARSSTHQAGSSSSGYSDGLSSSINDVSGRRLPCPSFILLTDRTSENERAKLDKRPDPLDPPIPSTWSLSGALLPARVPCHLTV